MAISGAARRAFRLAPCAFAILPLLAACSGGGGGAAAPTVTVTVPASTAPASSAPAGTPSGTSSAGGRPGIVAVTTAGALVRIDPTTGDIQQTLVASGVLGDEISVSPDQSTIYYAQRSGCDTEIKSISAAGGTPASIAPGQLPAISPDGTKLAFARQPVLTDAGCMPNQSNLAILFKIDIRTLPAGGDNVLSAPPELQSSGLFAPISHLSWAADSMRLAVSVASVQDNEGWGLNIVDTSVARYYVPPGSGITSVPVTGSDAQRSYIREGIFLPSGNMFISRACCGGVPIVNTSRLMWEVGSSGSLVHQVALGYPNLEHVSLAASPTGQFLLYIAGSDLYVSTNGNTPAKLTTGVIAATWM